MVYGFQIYSLKKKSIYTEKYNKEIFRMMSSRQNAQKLINNYFSKIFKEDFSDKLVELQTLSKVYCMKVKDSFKGKGFGFEIIICDCGNKVDFNIKTKDIVLEDFSDSLPELASCLKKEVYGQFFRDVFI